jgi:hypothetical protein
LIWNRIARRLVVSGADFPAAGVSGNIADVGDDDLDGKGLTGSSLRISEAFLLRSG